MEDNISLEQSLISFVMALALPFFLIPIEAVLPYPYVIEELAKLSLVGRVVQNGGGIWTGATVGLLFALSETILYVVNASILGNFGVLVERLVLTVPMHVVTATIISVGARRGILGAILGTVVGMGIHWAFNVWVA